MIDHIDQTDTCRFQQNDRLSIGENGHTGKKPASQVIFCARTAKIEAWTAIFCVWILFLSIQYLGELAKAIYLGIENGLDFGQSLDG